MFVSLWPFFNGKRRGEPVRAGVRVFSGVIQVYMRRETRRVEGRGREGKGEGEARTRYS